MALVSEWFRWGQGNMFYYGFCIIIIAMLIPWTKRRARLNYIVLALCVCIYLISEIAVSNSLYSQVDKTVCHPAYFVGGNALSIAIGRIMSRLLTRTKAESACHEPNLS